jgi:hypothetical protein
MVDTHGGTNVITLPLDKLVAATATPGAAPATPPAAAPTSVDPVPVTVDPRTRDNPRGRDRDGR